MQSPRRLCLTLVTPYFGSTSVGPNRTWWALAGLLAFSALVRAALFLSYPPSVHLDTGTYFSLAQQIASLDLTEYDGGRTPTYPLLIALAGLDQHGVYFLQLLLGLTATALLFFTVLAFKRSLTLAVLVGLVPTVMLNQLFMEASLLSEHVTGVLAVAALYVAVTILMRGGGLGRTILLGLLVAATVLARPGYVAFIPVYALVVWLQPDARIVRTAAYLAAACLPMVAWMALNALTVGQFSLSARLGLGLMNHSGAFIEHANPRYTTIRDIYLRHRAEVVRSPEALSHRQGEQYVTIFYALDDLKKATGLSQNELARELQALSLDLFWRHPDLYARSVFKAWLSYWAAPNYWRPNTFRIPRIGTVAAGLWRIEQPLIRFANLAMVIAVTVLLLQTVAAAARTSLSAVSADRHLLVLLVAGGGVLWFSVFQAAFEYGENGRYGIPTQQIVLAFLVLYLSWVVDRRYLGELARFFRHKE